MKRFALIKKIGITAIAVIILFSVFPKTETKAADFFPVVTGIPGDHSVTLNWNDIPDADGYGIYSCKQTFDGDVYTLLAETTNTSYTQTGLTNGNYYTYVVVAYFGAIFSPYMSAKKITVMPYVSPPMAPLVTAIADDGQITLSWDPVTSCTDYVEYTIWVFNNITSQFDYLSTILNTSFTQSGLENGKEYIYLVRACDKIAWSVDTSTNIVSVIPSPITSISILSPPIKTFYAIGESIDLTGAQILVNYNGVFTKTLNVTIEMISGYDVNKIGTQTIKVTYHGKTTSFDVTNGILGVTYSSHIQNIGWMNPTTNGSLCGTLGQSLRVEALKINLMNTPADLKIKYRVHVQNIGWMDWVENGQIAGTSGQSLRIEAIQIKLEGTDADKYSVQYQTHVQNIGWQDPVWDGATAGTSGQSLRVEAIRIQIVDKIPAAPSVTYQGHVQNIGWQNWVSDGDLCGTSGLSYRVEAFKIQLVNPPAGLRIKYKAHVQNIGWMDWVYDGAIAGTSGQSLRVEALQIVLEGTDADKYSVEYQAHVQNIGWQPWVKDGAIAGTSGMSYRVEAVRIRIVPKTSQ